MCYKVHTHTMSCDVRPIISSARTHYINPYETPPNCACPNPHTSHAKRCPSHGCCRLSSSLRRCPRQCWRPTHYHRYVCDHHHPSSSSSRQSYHYYYSPRSGSPSTHPIHARIPWRNLPIFDRDPDFHAAESSDFGFAVSELLDIGRILLHAETELEKGRLRIERERGQHRESHGGRCSADAGVWACGWSRRIGMMVAERDDLKLSAEVLGDCWTKYTGLLKKYEGLGQRRVGGIVEVPRKSGGGQQSRRRSGEYHRSEEPRREGRHRSEESHRGRECRPGEGRHENEDRIQVEEEKPWRYLRRDSGNLGGASGRESRREREGDRRHSTREYVVEEGRIHRKPKNAERRRSWWHF